MAPTVLSVSDTKTIGASVRKTSPVIVSLTLGYVETGNDSVVTAFRHGTFGVASRHPCDSLLGVSDNIGKSLRGDGEQPGRLVGRIREVVQPVWAFREVHDISGRKLLFALGSAHGWCSAEDEEHLLHAVVH